MVSPHHRGSGIRAALQLLALVCLPPTVLDIPLKIYLALWVLEYSLYRWLQYQAFQHFRVMPAPDMKCTGTKVVGLSSNILHTLHVHLQLPTEALGMGHLRCQCAKQERCPVVSTYAQYAPKGLRTHKCLAEFSFFVPSGHLTPLLCVQHATLDAFREQECSCFLIFEWEGKGEKKKIKEFP